MNAKENQPVSVTLTLNQWSHVLASLRTAHRLLAEQYEDDPANHDSPPVAAMIARFGEPLTVVPEAHDAIASQVEVATGESAYFSDRARDLIEKYAT